MRDPSGEKAGEFDSTPCGSFVRGVAALPSASIMQMFRVVFPLRQVNAILVPSGEKAGVELSSAVPASGSWFVPSRFITYIRYLASIRTKAIRLPSGEKVGWMS